MKLNGTYACLFRRHHPDREGEVKEARTLAEVA
jgi:hypothetical protein